MVLIVDFMSANIMWVPWWSSSPIGKGWGKGVDKENENMVLIKKYLQGNEHDKNVPYGNTRTEKFNN